MRFDWPAKVINWDGEQAAAQQEQGCRSKKHHHGSNQLKHLQRFITGRNLSAFSAASQGS
jgi:hypothetical protein